MSTKRFIPFPDKIVIEPFTHPSYIPTDDEMFEEMGTVISVGSSVTFCRKGDVIFFLAHGSDKTPEVDGKRWYVVTEHSSFILGKYAKEKKEKHEE